MHVDMTKSGTLIRYLQVPALVATTILVACGGEGGGLGWTSVADTVGGTVRVENTPPKTGGGLTLVGVEELRIGTVEGSGPTSFGLIRSVAVLPDGRFAVADSHAEEVRVFGPDGEHLRTFGGEGEGPGKLKGMLGVHLDAEGMLRVAERSNSRLSVFHPDTGFLRTHPLRLYSFGFRGPWDAAVDSAGRTFVASSGQFGEGRYWEMVRVYDSEMTQIDSFPYRDYTDEGERDDVPSAWRITLGDRGYTWAPVPFYAQQQEVLSPPGEFWTSTEGRLELEVARWTPGGDTALVFTSRRTPDPVTPAARDSAMTELRERLEPRVPSLRQLDASRVPASKPPVYALSLDDRGRLWARITEPHADTTVFDVFDRTGIHAETVGMPFRVDPWIPPLVRGDAAWMVVTDELEVQYVVRVRLSRVPRSIEAADVARFNDSVLSTVEDGRSRNHYREMFDLMPVNETFPAFSSMHFDGEGNLWVQDYPLPGAGQLSWQVFDQEGLFAARVEIPLGLRVLDIGSDYVLGLVKDELDVERIRRYALATTPD